MTALTPIELGEDSTAYHVGYWKAQNDIKMLIEHHINSPEPVGEVPAGGWDRTVRAHSAS